MVRYSPLIETLLLVQHVVQGFLCGWRLEALVLHHLLHKRRHGLHMPRDDLILLAYTRVVRIGSVCVCWPACLSISMLKP